MSLSITILVSAAVCQFHLLGFLFSVSISCSIEDFQFQNTRAGLRLATALSLVQTTKIL